MRWVAALGLCLIAGLVDPLGSEPTACADCRHTCEAGEVRDPHGCCHPKSGTSKSKKKAKVTKKTKKKPTKKPTKKSTKKPKAPPDGATTTATLPSPEADVATVKPKAGKKQRTAAQLAKACKGGDGDDCAEFALAYDGVDPELEDATLVTMYQRGCDASGARACVRLGYLYENGKGTSQDFQRARELYQSSCDGDDAVGCHALGRIYYLALGVVKDADKALRLFKKACDGGVAAACSDTGFVYENIKYDYTEAATWYLTACDQSDPTGCRNAALLFQQAGDYDRAAELNQRACALGLYDACQ